MTPALLLATLLLAPRSPFVSVTDAARLLTRGAVVLDARDGGDFRRGHLPGAQRIDWKDTRDGWGRTGRLGDDDAELARRLGALGVDDQRPVLVVGAANQGWGEEGRIAWMLQYLGLREVDILDGGFRAWSAAGRPVETGGGADPPRRSFVPRRQAALRAELPDVERWSREGGAVLLDVRTRNEWDGATPYFEPRGGHIPNARHLPWTNLLDGSGAVLSAESIAAQLAPLGIGPRTPVVVYCTGGVRSAFVWAVLRASGYTDVKNFDGSFYQWSKERRLPIAR
jgi:thiosulfate/3-mercaptopyruvate sulfurtransferase